MGHPLIDEFVSHQLRVEELVRAGDLSSAQASYRSLCNSYQRVLSAPVEDVHKRIAFEEVSSTFQLLQSLQQSSKASPVNPVVASSSLSSRDIAVFSCLIALLVGVLVVDPSTVGFSFLGSGVLVKAVNASFDSSSTLPLSLNVSPSALWVSGSLSGGSAKVFLGERVVVDTVRDGSSFRRVCGEACALSGVSGDVVLRVEVNGGVLRIDSVSFSSS